MRGGLVHGIDYRSVVWIRGCRGNLKLPSAIARDSLGRIHVSDWGLGRIQRYSTSGRFKKGWAVKAAGAYFEIEVKDDLIYAGVARGGGVYCFDGEGKVVGHYPEGQGSAVVASRKVGVLVLEGGVFPRVVDAAAQRTVISSEGPVLLQVLGNRMVLVVVGMGSLVGLALTFRKKAT